jgi:hypothetical protein
MVAREIVLIRTQPIKIGCAIIPANCSKSSQHTIRGITEALKRPFFMLADILMLSSDQRKVYDAGQKECLALSAQLNESVWYLIVKKTLVGREKE